VDSSRLKSSGSNKNCGGNFLKENGHWWKPGPFSVWAQERLKKIAPEDGGKLSIKGDVEETAGLAKRGVKRKEVRSRVDSRAARK